MGAFCSVEPGDYRIIRNGPSCVTFDIVRSPGFSAKTTLFVGFCADCCRDTEVAPDLT